MKAKSKKDERYEEKLRKQKYRRGYSDRDVYNLCYEFPKVMASILKDYKKKACSYFTLDENLHRILDDKAHEKEDIYIARRDQLLDRMIFLLNEIDEDKCSMKNPYRKDVHKAQDRFCKKYCFGDEKLKSKEQIAKEKEEGLFTHYSFTDDPDHKEENKKLLDEFIDYERRIGEYKEDCKNEFLICSRNTSSIYGTENNQMADAVYTACRRTCGSIV